MHEVTYKLTIYLRNSQVSRALQGKTAVYSADAIMRDERHDTAQFMAYLDANASNADRPRDIYWGLAMIPLFVYGHHTKAIELGIQMMETMPRLWSARVAYVVYFYLALSLLTLHNDYPARGYLDGNLKIVLKYKAEVDFARSACDVNYGMWSLILEALIYEVRNDHTSAIQTFEVKLTALDVFVSSIKLLTPCDRLRSTIVRFMDGPWKKLLPWNCTVCIYMPPASLNVR